jgi:hypothetical protein
MQRYGLLCGLVAVAALAAPPRNDAWEVLGPGGGGSMYAPTVSPHDTRDVLIHCDMTGSYISHDGGNSFRMFNLRGTTRFFTFDPSDANTIYVQTIGLWRSINRGKTWRLVYPDPASVSGIRMPDDHAGEMLVSTAEPRGRMTALAVDPENSKMLYAAIGAGLYTSPDWGKTWTNVADLRDGARRIYIDPRSPAADRTLYVIGGKSVGVREGGRWAYGEPPQGVAQFTAVSGGFPEKGGRLAVYATSAAGAFSSDDGGRSWHGVSLKLPFKPRVPAMAASEQHGEIAYLA